MLNIVNDDTEPMAILEEDVVEDLNSSTGGEKMIKSPSSIPTALSYNVNSKRLRKLPQN